MPRRPDAWVIDGDGILGLHAIELPLDPAATPRRAA